MGMSMMLICFALRYFMVIQVGARSSTITNNCSCAIRGKIFNLEPLADINQNPRFQTDNGINNYAYNPCLPFTRSKCESVAVCRWDTHMKSFTVMGLQDYRPDCQLYENHPEMVYKVSEKSKIKTYVRLRCNPQLQGLDDGRMRLIKDDNQTELVIEIEHACCCPDKCKDGLPLINPPPESCPLSKNVPFLITVILASVLLVGLSLSTCYYWKKAKGPIRHVENPPPDGGVQHANPNPNPNPNPNINDAENIPLLREGRQPVQHPDEANQRILNV